MRTKFKMISDIEFKVLSSNSTSWKSKMHVSQATQLGGYDAMPSQVHLHFIMR